MVTKPYDATLFPDVGQGELPDLPSLADFQIEDNTGHQSITLAMRAAEHFFEYVKATCQSFHYVPIFMEFAYFLNPPLRIGRAITLETFTAATEDQQPFVYPGAADTSSSISVPPSRSPYLRAMATMGRRHHSVTRTGRGSPEPLGGLE